MNLFRKIILCIVSILLLNSLEIICQNEPFVTVKAQRGDGIYSLLSKHELPITEFYLDAFRELNKGKISQQSGLYNGFEYQLPIKIFKFDGRTIRSTIKYDDYDNALDIQRFNENLLNKNILKQHYRQCNILWVPLANLKTQDVLQITEKPSKDSKVEKNVYPIFGKDFEVVEKIDNTLDKHIYFLSSGHGGPDPGAIGYRNEHMLCEDEYAYDVTLRLARKLLQHGATVFIIVQDPDDGIRDDEYLECDTDEIYIGGDTISHLQTIRLRKRAEIINDLYNENLKTAKSQQALMIHVDSRSQDRRIDIFFYYNPGSTRGQLLANTIYSTIKERYEINQPGRGYHGTVTDRNLYMLKNTLPTAVYIELGNIQNKHDQFRFIDKNNRQAISNWLFLGLSRFALENK